MSAKESRVCTGVASTGSEGKKTVWNNYYKGKQGWGLMETEGGFWPHHGWVDAWMLIECLY